MAQNKIIFSTYCEDHLQERFGANKLVNSFKYFHPDHQIVLYNSEDILKVHQQYGVNYSNALPCIMLDAKNRFDADYICHLDADSLVLGTLDKILDLDYEIASCLNNPDIGDRNERQNRPQQLWKLPNNKYVSCGCLSTNSEKFLHEWISLNRQITENFGKITEFWMCDQNMMNILFHYSNYTAKILDPLDSNVFYGPSANIYSDNKTDPAHIIQEWGINTWKSWQDIEYKDNQFWLYNKIVKLIHQSGGGKAESAIKLHFSMFNDKTRGKLQEITGFNV